MSEIDNLYAIYNILDAAKDDAAKHAAEYQTLIAAAAGTTREKLLAAQFLPKFFKSFPDLMNEALNAHLDMCEDPDVTIRIGAIKYLPLYCTDLPQIVPRISAILTQILSSDQSVESMTVKDSLAAMFKNYPILTLRGMFDQIPSLSKVEQAGNQELINNNNFNNINQLRISDVSIKFNEHNVKTTDFNMNNNIENNGNLPCSAITDPNFSSNTMNDMGSCYNALKFILDNVRRHPIFNDVENIKILINDIYNISDLDLDFDILINILSLKRFYIHSKDILYKIFIKKLTPTYLKNLDELNKFLRHAHKFNFPIKVYEELVLAVFVAVVESGFLNDKPVAKTVDEIPIEVAQTTPVAKPVAKKAPAKRGPKKLVAETVAVSTPAVVKPVQPAFSASDLLQTIRLLCTCIKDSTPSADFDLHKIFDIIFDFLPIAPVETDDITTVLSQYDFNYDYLEVLLTILQLLYNKNPNFNNWNVKGNESIKPFADKLQFLHRIVLHSLSNNNKTVNRVRILAPGQTEADAMKIAPTGARATIIGIIKNFLHVPPLTSIPKTEWFKQMDGKKMSVSTVVEAPETVGGHKRINPPPGAETKPSKVRISPQLYVPPGARRSGFTPTAPPASYSSDTKYRNRIRFR